MPNYIVSEKIGHLEYALVDVKEWQEAIFKFIKEESREGWISEKELFDWRNLGLENGECHGIICCVVIDEHCRIKGHIFAICACIKYNDTEYKVSWPVDYYISESLRGKGAGKKLLMYLDKNSPNLLLMGGPARTYKIFHSLGWKIDRRIDKYVYIVNPLSYFKKSKSKTFSKISNIIKSANFLKQCSKKIVHKYKELAQASTEIDNFVKNNIPKETVIFTRPRDRLKWLVDGLKKFNAKYILMYDGDDIIGYSVIKLGTSKNGLIEGSIVDIYVTNFLPEYFSQLIDINISVLKRESVDLVNIYASYSELKKILRKKQFNCYGQMNFGINKKLPSWLDNKDWHITMFESDYGYR